MSERELRPCPFCEGSNLYVADSYQGDPLLYNITCKDCNVKWLSADLLSFSDAWNTRPLEDKLRAENNELATKCSRLNAWIDELISQSDEVSNLVEFIRKEREE